GESLCNFFCQKVYVSVHPWAMVGGRVRGLLVRPEPENRGAAGAGAGEGLPPETSPPGQGRGEFSTSSYPHPGPDLTPVRIWPTPVRIWPGGGPNLAPY